MFLGDGLFLRFDTVCQCRLLGATLFVDGSGERNEEGSGEGNREGNREGSEEGAPTSSRGLQPDQTSGWEGEVPAVACVP